MEKDALIKLVCAAQNGIESAATDLYNAFQKDLYYHILKTVNEPALAEDLLQDTFIEILQTINNLNDPAAFPSWSKQVAYHKCTAYFKKRRELLADEKEDGFSVFDTLEEDNAEFIPDEALDKADLKQTIQAMIDELPEEQRSALLLRYFDEISVKEIAEVQGVTEGTVKSRLNYGRKAIKAAVEGYEKKHGVKLRCAGVIPLLLWLFREISVSNGISLASATASTAYTAANATTPVVAEGVKATTKIVRKFAAKKIIAGITAATVIAGGVGAAVLLKPKPAPKSDPMLWCGYGIVSYTQTRRFELTIDEMNDKSISGHLEVSHLYETVHDTEFTGKGAAHDGDVIYEIVFDNPAVIGTIPSVEYETMELEYDKDDEQFSFNAVYKVDMERQDKNNPAVLAENKSWSGLGEDGCYNALKNKDHLFELGVSKMTEADISGTLTVSYNGKTDHLSKFSGRGYKDEGIVYYEVLLETPRTETNIMTSITIDRFWLEYNIETGVFEIPPSAIYSVKMEKK